MWPSGPICLATLGSSLAWQLDFLGCVEPHSHGLCQWVLAWPSLLDELEVKQLQPGPVIWNDARCWNAKKKHMALHQPPALAIGGATPAKLVMVGPLVAEQITLDRYGTLKLRHGRMLY